MTLALSAVLFGVGANGQVAASTKSGALKPSTVGELDCNGYSPAQKSLRAMTCTDIKGIAGVDNQNTWGGKFYDNGQYIGHDEPDTTFVSSESRLRQQRHLDGETWLRSDRFAHSRDPREGRLALVRAVGGPVVLDGPVRSKLLSASTLHPQLGRQRPDDHIPRRGIGVHGDAVLPAGRRAVHRQREL